jgi:Cys-tRNA(Pro) deacylase
MSRQEIPATQAVRMLRQNGARFVPHFYTYEEQGGTRVASLALAVDEHAVIKTLVFQTDMKQPFLVLMHGDLETSSKQLARTLGVKQVTPCDVASAERITGYTVGGISPFGTRSRLPVLAERTIFALPRIWINGGRRGFLVEIAPALMKPLLDIVEVDVGIGKG